MKSRESEKKNRYDSSAVLFILMILEKEALNRSRLAGRLAAMGINYTERTINRRLIEAENLGFHFERKGHEIVLLKSKSFALSLMRLLSRWNTESAALKSRIIGTIDPERVAGRIENNSASFLHDLVKAASEGFLIEFNYKPQTEETSRKLVDSLKNIKSGFLKHKSHDCIKVQMLPHYLVFSGSEFLVLGETCFSKNDIRQRQYSVAGISNLTLKEIALKSLNINPSELYQYSINVWIDGTLYDLEVEEKLPAGDLRRKKIKVNGEAEILSYAASKLGNFKILNPPKTLVDKARETPGLCEMIFLQKDI
ncbi:MAG: hypothetical protein OEV78_07085 [Spirochaetia bacterium]|nr:hypothetical protein [Spirochaetia bacterium]